MKNVSKPDRKKFRRALTFLNFYRFCICPMATGTFCVKACRLYPKTLIPPPVGSERMHIEFVWEGNFYVNICLRNSSYILCVPLKASNNPFYPVFPLYSGAYP